MLICVSTAQARTKWLSAFWLTLGRGIFPVNVRVKWLLQNVEVHCDPAVSHNVVLGSGPRHFSCKFLYEVALVTC